MYYSFRFIRFSSRYLLKYKVSDYFESAIKSLPTDHCEDDHVQNLYIRVIEEFGTHFTTDVVMGAKAIQEVKFKNSDLDRLSSEGISASVRIF